MNPYEARSLRRAKADRDALWRLVEKLHDQALEDMARRGSQAAGPDGYPAGGNSEGSGSGPGRPTEMAAVALLEGTTERDNVGRWLGEVFGLLDLLATTATSIEGRLALVAKAGTTERTNTVELCADCNEPAPKVKRLDGHPYHPGACFMRAYRRTGRGPRENGYTAFPQVRGGC